MVPGVVTFMPLFVIVSKLGLVNTHAGLILPFLAGAFGVFLMRQFILGIPDELLEAARVDGAGEYYIFFRIVLPLCGPALATLGMLTFLGSWNSFLWPLVVASTEDMYTLPVALALFSTASRRPTSVCSSPGASRRAARAPAVLRHAALGHPGHLHDRHQVTAMRQTERHPAPRPIPWAYR